MSDVYDGGFDNWADIQSQFDEPDLPEPDEVLFAMYDVDGYEGSARVVYRQGNRFFYVHGAHCSCYGLEGQWDPEEYSAEQFVAAYERGWWKHYVPSSVRDRVKEFMENKYNGA